MPCVNQILVSQTYLNENQPYQHIFGRIEIGQLQYPTYIIRESHAYPYPVRNTT
jgi:hypothetical protein